MKVFEREGGLGWHGEANTFLYGVAPSSSPCIVPLGTGYVVGKDGSLTPTPDTVGRSIACPAGFLIHTYGEATSLSLSVERKTAAGWEVIFGPVTGNPSVGGKGPGVSFAADNEPMTIRVVVHSVTGGDAGVSIRVYQVAEWVGAGADPWFENACQ